jgi:glycosyltransferase involved in cell wall biosynthesis
MSEATGKKVAFVITSMAGGGAERTVLDLAREMRRLGSEACVVSLRDVEQYDLSGEAPVRFLARETRPGDGASRPERLRALVRRLEEDDGRPFDLIVASLPEAWLAVSRSGLPRVVYRVGNSVRGALRQTRWRRPTRYLRARSRFRLLRGKRLVAICEELARELREIRWLGAASVTSIYNPIDTALIRRRAAEEVEGIPEAPFVLHVGRAARQKRHDLLLRAFRWVPEPYRLVLLAGRPEKLGFLIARHGLRRRVILPGFQQNPYAWMGRAALTVLSSDYEGFGRVAAESLAAGTPVVSTACPHGPSEILTGELARWLVPVGDPIALGRRMTEALETEIDVSAPESLRRFDPETVTRKYLALAGEDGPRG